MTAGHAARMRRLRGKNSSTLASDASMMTVPPSRIERIQEQFRLSG
jgi:hypothetical protein